MDNLYNEIVISTPTLKEGHGSNRKSKCNNPSCKLNRGNENHRLTQEEFTNKVNKRYNEILRDKI